MRFLFSTLGSFGDLAPFIVLALALKKRGHECVFVVNPYHRRNLDKWGLDLIPAGDSDLMESRFRDKRVNHPLKVVHYLAESALAELPEQYEVIMDNVTTDTVLVYRGTMLAPRLVEEKLGLPACGVFLTALELSGVTDRPGVLGPITNPVVYRMRDWIYKIIEKQFTDRRIDRPLLPTFNSFRKEIGLPPVKGSIRRWLIGCRLPLGLYPDWYGWGGGDLSDKYVSTGFAFLPTDEVTPLDPGLESFLAAGEPPVVISRGSALRYADDLVEQVRELCQELGKRTLVLSFDHEGPVKVDGNDCISAPVSIGRVLPRCMALVHRGGVGATGDALRFGIPQLILGQSIDHPDNGERVTRMGAGRWVFTLTASRARLKRALDAVVNDPALTEGAQEISRRFDVDGWLQESIRHLESLGVKESSDPNLSSPEKN